MSPNNTNFKKCTQSKAGVTPTRPSQTPVPLRRGYTVITSNESGFVRRQAKWKAAEGRQGVGSFRMSPNSRKAARQDTSVLHAVHSHRAFLISNVFCIRYSLRISLSKVASCFYDSHTFKPHITWMKVRSYAWNYIDLHPPLVYFAF